LEVGRNACASIHDREASVNSLPFLPGELPEPTPEQAAQAPGRGTPRLRVPHRDQVEYSWASLDERLDPDSPARAVWALVCRLDLDTWLADIKAIEGHVGRNATDPRLLVALWVFATLKAIGSARELERLCENHLAYQWLCGGVSVNYHMLADFRSQGGEKWDALLTQIVATLRAEGLVTMERVAQDGMRVRADAGKSSFRTGGRLEELLAEAEAQVKALKELAETNPDELSRRQQAARERAAAEREARVAEAARQCQELQRKKEERNKGRKEKTSEARVSTTDPDARNIKFSDGGYRPAFNVQFATDTATGIVVGVDVTNAGTDSEEMPPMVDQLETRYNVVPDEMLVDGGFASLDAIDAIEGRGSKVYAPIKDEEKQKKAGKAPYARKPHDTDNTAAWRQRMGTEAAQVIYKLRAQTAEWVNAMCRNRGLWQMPVRGPVKCRIVATLYAITHNLIHQGNVRAAAAETTG
jgi:transposase